MHSCALGDSPHIMSLATLRQTVSFQARCVGDKQNQVATVHTHVPTEMWLTEYKHSNKDNTINRTTRCCRRKPFSCFTARFFSASSLRLTKSSQQNSGQHADGAGDKGSQPWWPNAQTVLLRAVAAAWSMLLLSCACLSLRAPCFLYCSLVTQ